MQEHKPDRSCCTPQKVRLQHDLFNRMRGRPYYSPDEYARAFASFEGQEVVALHTFEGPGGVHSYTVELPGLGSYHLPALYADPVGRFGFEESDVRVDRHDRETFIAALLAAVPTATRAHALQLLRWGTTYGRLCLEDCNGDWPIRRHDQAEWRKMLDAQTERAERIIRETCKEFGRQHNNVGRGGPPYAWPHFQGDPRGHTVRLQIAGAPLDAYEQPALAVPTS